MKTLYLSDLDGTLLRPDETISAYTSSTINDLAAQGMIFSYATARSYVTSKKVTKGLRAKIPLIVYNGAFVRDNVTEDILIANYFENNVRELLQQLLDQDVYPIVYSYIGGVETFSYIEEACTKGMADFLITRKGDPRANPVTDTESLLQGNCFYITCIGQPEKLEPLYKIYKEQYHCVYQQDIYTKEQWLEIMPRKASKAHAALQLKKLSGCSRLVAFGDGKNDLDLFAVADESYAVENAVEELKAAATGVILSNQEDGVAKWLKHHVRDI